MMMMITINQVDPNSMKHSTHLVERLEFTTKLFAREHGSQCNHSAQ